MPRIKDLRWMGTATRVHPTKRHLVNEAPIVPLMACHTREETHAKPTD
jgi:hypothetical protein